jgi:hypothetical protein
MFNLELFSIILSGIITGLIFLLTLPSIPRLIYYRSQNRYNILSGRDDINAIYEDEDGAATPDSQAAYSSRKFKIIIGLVAALGFVSSLASAVLNSVLVDTRTTPLLLVQDWTNVAAWVCSPTCVDWLKLI